MKRKQMHLNNLEKKGLPVRPTPFPLMPNTGNGSSQPPTITPQPQSTPPKK
jgi:hypothetical protein